MVEFQHASMCRERAISTRDIGERSHAIERPSSHSYVSLAHNETPTSHVHVVIHAN